MERLQRLTDAIGDMVVPFVCAAMLLAMIAALGGALLLALL